MGKLLDSHDHHCFHSFRGNIHTHPDLHHCLEQNCPGAISKERAEKAGFIDAEGNVKCPVCDCDTYPSGERRVVEIHAKLCTDETIHYPQWRKSGKITEDQFQAWKSTLTRSELLGHYKRTEDIHLTVQFHHDEADMVNSDLDSFNTLLDQRIRERAETTLLFQTPHKHKTTPLKVSL